MLKRRCLPATCWGRVQPAVVTIPASFFALALAAGQSGVAAASEVRGQVVTDPVARDDAAIVGLSFRGKRLGLNSG